MWQRTLQGAAAIAALAAAVPARAERLVFDHRLYPPLKAVFDGGQDDRIAYDARNPRYVVDLIAVQGKSAAEWSEALEIIARSPGRGMKTAQDWAGEMRNARDGCVATVTPLADDGATITFERSAPGCKTARAETALTRILAGKRSLFRLTFLLKGAPDEATRKQWLALLASARIE